MGENSKNQILSQEMVRRLMNTSEGLQREQYWKIADEYADKLQNSGYRLEQIRRIILAGIKGYGAKKLRSLETGKPLRRFIHSLYFKSVLLIHQYFTEPDYPPPHNKPILD